jgi:hypothetical protein
MAWLLITLAGMSGAGPPWQAKITVRLVAGALDGG